MKIVSFTVLLLSIFNLVLLAQHKNPYHLPIINAIESYQSHCKENPDFALVDLKLAVPSIEIEVKYASKDNFMKKVMYEEAKVFARKIVATQLKKVQDELNNKGLGLKVFDGYRPYQVTLDFYVNPANRAFVANPKLGSKHNRGCAMDLTIIDLKNSKELDMGTPYDSFLKTSAPFSKNISPTAKKNRSLLINTMRKYGFNVIKTEWWHYDYKDWKNYPLMDLSFKELALIP